MNKVIKEKIAILIFISLAACMVLSAQESTLLAPNHPNIFNYLTVILQAKTALLEGQFPLRDLLLNGLRYPYFQFYSPTTYWFAAILYQWLTPNNPYLTYKILLWVSAVCGGCYMYKLAKVKVTCRFTALLVSLIYLFSPYYLIVLNQLNYLNEGIALGIIPAAVFYTWQVYKNFGLSNFLKCNVAWYVLITVHVLSFFYCALIVLSILFLNTLSEPKKIKNFLMSLFTLCLAMVSASWYLLPLILFSPHMIWPTLPAELGKQINSLPFLSLISVTANYVPSTSQYQIMQILPAIGAPILGGLVCYMYLWKKINFKIFNITALLILTIFLYLWLPISILHNASYLAVIQQHKWILLGQLVWMGALITGYVIAILTHDKLTLQGFLLGVFIIMISTATWHPYSSVTHRSIANFLKNSDGILLTPSYAAKNDIALQDQQIVDVSETIKNCHPLQNTLDCTVKTSASKNWIELPVYYFPNMLQISVDEKPISYSAHLNKDATLAAIKVNTEGMHDISILFSGLPLANNISVSIWLIYLLLFISNVFSKKTEFKND